MADNTATVRDRDNMHPARILIEQLTEFLTPLINCYLNFVRREFSVDLAGPNDIKSSKNLALVL